MIRHHVRLSVPDMFGLCAPIELTLYVIGTRASHIKLTAALTPPPPPFHYAELVSNLLARGQEQTSGYTAFQSLTSILRASVYTYTFDTNLSF
jgi:hypothetical protein